MIEIYLVIVILLFLTATADLVVGVSNDAVNFLNSAIGSKVAPRHVIMIVASIGLMLGATFASSMMEVAREGIFNPDFFVFSDVIAIFLAVMMTDIILLDFFNTFGLPTSTTVSIVFELLGAGVALGVVKSFEAGNGFGDINEYINTSSALTIVTSIFLSVGVAFTLGTALMYVSRLIFSYQYERRLKWFGGIWSGLAMTAMTHFLLIKGIKGASFVTPAFTAWIGSNTMLLLGGFLLFWTLFMQLLLSVFRVNVLRILVLFGTFALAMAFAGNDLVNFIGVPLAGFVAFQEWKSSGQAAGEFSMSILKNDYPTETFMLVIAGIIMIVTLWLSRKARTVTDTEVSLGRQQEGLERFSPNWLAQWIVRGVRGVGNGMLAILPKDWTNKLVESTQEPNPQPKGAGTVPGQPAFDLLRAAVNLTVASAVIALGTSYKLPLSTTYVTFMVAMGSSLADHAWGRDSAVYRVAGVVNVIGGWFATAFIAFTVCGTFAFLIYSFGMVAIIGLILLAIFFFTRTFIIHKRRDEIKTRLETEMAKTEEVTTSTIISDTSTHIAQTIEEVRTIYGEAIQGLRDEDLNLLKKAEQAVKALREQNEEFKYAFYNNIGRIQEEDGRGSRTYLLVYDLEQDILQAIEFIVNACREHVRNSHKPLKKGQEKKLSDILGQMDKFLDRVGFLIRQQDMSLYESLVDEKEDLLFDLEKLLDMQIEGIKKKTYNARNSLLFFSLLLETKDLINVAASFAKLYYRLHSLPPDEYYQLLSGRKKGKKSLYKPEPGLRGPNRIPPEESGKWNPELLE